MRRAIACACACAIAIGLAGGARAHLGHVILRAERYIKLDASHDDTRVVVSLMLGPEEGERILGAADADHDGRVTRAEADAYLVSWAEGLATEVPISIDGARTEVEWTDGWLDPIGRVRRVALNVEMVAHLPITAREHRIAIEDRMVRRETFDRTDVAFSSHDGADLLACGTDASAEPTDCAERELAIVRGGPQPTTFLARVRYPRRSDRIPVVALAGPLALVALALVVLAVVRARRRHGAPPASRGAPSS